MNEIAKIHLARTSYEIDAEAKKELVKYLIAVRKSLGEEIDAMEDIEIRMTEILATRGIVKGDVVTISDIKAIKEQLGEPAGFSDKNENWNDGSFTRGKGDELRKRFYRDEDNGVIAGVIAGVAVYTGWNLTALRVLYVVLAIFTGIIPLGVLYIIAWVILPAAETASEKLEMRGESIDIESIKEQVKNTAERALDLGVEVTEKVNEKMSDKMKELNKKFSDKRNEIKKSGDKHKINPILRVISVLSGIVLLIWFLPALVILIITMTTFIFFVIPMDITAKTLFILSVLLILNSAIQFCVGAVILSFGMIKRKISRGIWVCFIMSVALLIGAAVSGGIWFSQAGADDFERVGDTFLDKINTRTRRNRVNLNTIETEVNLVDQTYQTTASATDENQKPENPSVLKEQADQLAIGWLVNNGITDTIRGKDINMNFKLGRWVWEVVRGNINYEWRFYVDVNTGEITDVNKY